MTRVSSITPNDRAKPSSVIPRRVAKSDAKMLGKTFPSHCQTAGLAMATKVPAITKPQLVMMPPRSLGIQDLAGYMTYLDNQGRESAPYRLAFWEKLLQPLTITSLVLVAISFVFGPLRSVTMGYRVFAGVVVGVVFRTLQDLLGPASIVFGFEPLIAVVAPALVLILIGGGMLRRAG